MDQKTNEISAMCTLLDPWDLNGTLITSVVENKQADDLLIAKGNQPTLETDLRALAPEDFPPPVDTWDKVRRRLAHRRIRTSTALNNFVTFPYLRQVFWLKRKTTILKTGEVRCETVVGLSSRDPAELPPEALMEAIRLHWTIENKVH